MLFFEEALRTRNTMLAKALAAWQQILEAAGIQEERMPSTASNYGKR